MRAVITRPQEDAERLAVPLRARGFSVLAEPLVTIRPLTGLVLKTDDLPARVLTSANGARALAAVLRDSGQSDAFALPVLAVGEQTGRVAQDLGFRSIATAAGEVHSLAALARATLDPRAGPLLHAAGTHLAGDLAALLAAGGFTVRRERLYEAETAQHFSPPLVAALRDRRVDALFFYSPRTAQTFAALAQQDDLGDSCGTVTAYCLSEAVARALSPLTFAALRVAVEPGQEALLAAVDNDLAAAGRTRRENDG